MNTRGVHLNVRLFSALAGTALALSIIAVPATETPSSATSLQGAAPTSPLVVPDVVSGSSTGEVSSAASTALASSDNSGILYVASHSNDLALAQAWVETSATQGLVVESPIQSSAALVTLVDSIGPAEVRLIGDPQGFPVGAKSALEASSYVVSDEQTSNDPFQWSSAAHSSSSRNNIVVVDVDETESVALATTYAANTGSSLLVLKGTEPTAAVGAILNDPVNESVLIIGDVTNLESLATFSDNDGSRYTRLGTAGVPDVALELLPAVLSQTSASIDSLVVATSEDATSAAIAGALAHRKGEMALTSSFAATYVPLLVGGPTSTQVVGVDASQANIMAIEALESTFEADPGFRVTDTTLSGGDTTVEVTAVTGAVRYRAYDAVGAPVGTSLPGIPEVTITGEPVPLEIVAEDSSGGALMSLQFKVNEYAEVSDHDNVMIGSTSDTRNYLKAVGPTDLPRLVTRLPINIMGGIPDPGDDTVKVAITCDNSFTDYAQDQSYEYRYRVTTLSADPSACGATSAPAPTDGLLTAGVTFPATQFPSNGTTLESEESASPNADSLGTLMARNAPLAESRRATSSLLETYTTHIAEAGSSDSVTSSSTWAPVMFRYQTWIPGEKIYAPGSTGDFWRRFQFFSGDDRTTFTPNGSFRTRQDLTVSFGSNASVTYNEWMGETIKYACLWPNGTSCIEQDRATAPLSGLWSNTQAQSSKGAKIELHVDAENPLHALAPAISSVLRFNLQEGGSTIKGKHDKMPVHAVWYSVVGWNEWYFAYGSTSYNPACLTGLPKVCTVDVNVRL